MDTMTIIVAVLGVLLSISEILGTFDVFKNSSVFTLVVDILKKAKDLLHKKA